MNTTSASPWQAIRQPPLKFLCSPWPWRSLAYVLSGAAVGIATLIMMSTLFILGLIFSFFGVGLVLLAGNTLAGIPVANIERRRLEVLTGQRYDAALPSPHMQVRDRGILNWLRGRVTKSCTWRELGYTLIFVIFTTTFNVATLALMALALVLISLPILVPVAPPGTVMVNGEILENSLAAMPYLAAGFAAELLLLYLVSVLAALHADLTRFMLSPRDEALRKRVHHLKSSRARLVNAFEAERRRIERDLHDGAQQRLLAVSMSLKLADLELDHRPQRCRELLQDAAAQAKHAIQELRELVHGIHPHILTDRGVEAAIKEVTTKLPLPVSVRISLPHRLPDAVEATAYFCVVELVTNIVKHSGANRAEVIGRLLDHSLVIDVTDNGSGGTNIEGGSGIQGLAHRLAVLDGTLSVASPPGGPTTVRFEIPDVVRPSPVTKPQRKDKG
jgi:signal transduction histidine kinase